MFGKVIRWLSLLITIFILTLHAFKSNNNYSNFKLFNEDYINYMSKNLETKNGTIKTLYKDKEPKEIPTKWSPSAFVQFEGEIDLISLRCNVIKFTPCPLSFKDKGSKYSISYFKYEHTNKYGNKDYYYFLFSMGEDRYKNINHYIKLYKSQHKTMFSVFISNVTIYITVFLFNLIIYFKVKKYVSYR